MYFYELHEGDEDLFSDLILAHTDEISPDDFYELVQVARRRVQDTFEQDTLIEAIAEELERDHGFTFISERRLTAAVNVSINEDENFLAEVVADEGEDADEDEEFGADYRGVIADFPSDRDD